MAVPWRPVGPLPAATYWRRRAVVAAVLVLLLMLVLYACLPAGGDDELRTGADGQAAPTADAGTGPDAALGPPATAGPDATDDPEAAGGAAVCLDDVVRVRASPDAESYRPGASPQLTVGVRNTGAATCTRDLGSAAVELLVLSGDDRIWSSGDCTPESDSDLRTLAPDEATTTSVTWDGRRSRPGCTGDREPARPGTYRVQARVGEVVSPPVAFTLTG
jgi:hypothetical protein